MKINRSKLIKLASCSAAGLALAQSVQAATTLTGLTDTNQDVPADHGSNAPDTPDITLDWSSVPEGGWDQYGDSNWGWWPNDNPAQSGVYQIDGKIAGEEDATTHTIVFTPGPGWNAVLTSLDLNVWTGGGEITVEWEVSGWVSGPLGSGTWTAAADTVTHFDINIAGTGGEPLVLNMVQASGRGSYLAMDNLAFDQISAPVSSFAGNKNLLDADPYEVTLTWKLRSPGASKVTISDGANIIDVTADTDAATGEGSRTFSVSSPSTTFVIDSDDSGQTQAVRILRAVENSAAFSLDSDSIPEGDPVSVTWNGADGNRHSWIGIYSRDNTPGPQKPDQWNYLNGTQTPDPEGSEPISDGFLDFTLPAGQYYAVLFSDKATTIEQGPILFEVIGQTAGKFPVTVARSGDNITLTWPSHPEYSYDIYASDTLEGDPESDWVNVRFDLPSGGDTTTWTEDLSALPGGTPAKRFYKIYEFTP